MLDKPFVVGDFIVVDGLRGEVERIDIKTKRVRSLYGELLVFSNADLLKSRIRNFKQMNERRVSFSVGIAYETAAEKVTRAPVGDFALNLEVVYYVLDRDYNIYMDVQQAINLELLRRFREAGIAYPTQTLYLRRTGEPPSTGVAACQP